MPETTPSIPQHGSALLAKVLAKVCHYNWTTPAFSPLR